MPDVRDLTAFYDTPLGQLARQVILRHVENFWPDLRGLRVLGYGFVLPYARLFTGCERAIAALPAPCGALAWSPHGNEGRNAALVCEEDALPFPDLFFDRILIVHGLESAESLRPLLRQLWRVLAPEGKILLVAPNRASLWAQVQVSPFGHGRPFSRMELQGLLEGALLEPLRWSRTLYAPPFDSVTGSGTGWERLGRKLVPGIGGVHVVEASKSLYAAATPGLAVPAPALKPAQDLGS